MLETTTKYILDLLTENEELKKFPKEFVNESVKWVKSWFLKPEEPKTNAKLEDPNRSIEVKKDIIQDKLDDLKDNTQFQKELTERLAAFEHIKTTKLNVIEGGSFKVKGNAHIGTVGESDQRQADEENVIKNAQFEVGGDFRLGNTTHIVHNYFGNSPKGQEKTPPQYNDVKSELKILLRKEKTGDVIERLLDLTEVKDKDLNNTVLLLSARLTRINNQEIKGIIGNNEAGIERNKINASLTSLIDDLDV